MTIEIVLNQENGIYKFNGSLDMKSNLDSTLVRVTLGNGTIIFIGNLTEALEKIKLWISMIR